MEYHRHRGGGRPRGGSDVGDGGDGRRARDINSREQGWMITLAIHAAYLGFNGLLYMLIQIKYQNLNNSPFETHMTMTSSLIALCVYFCAAALQIILMMTKKKLDDPRLLNHALVCSGILSPISNILVFLPNIVGWIVVLLFVFATTILLVYDVVKLISNCISVRNNRNSNNATPTSESMALEMSTNAATTSESLEISIENNNDTIRNNNDAVEMVLETISLAPHTPFHSFLNQGFDD